MGIIVKKYIKIFGIVFGLFTLEILILIFFKRFDLTSKIRVHNKIKIYGYIFGATVSMVSLYYFRKVFFFFFQYKINGKVEIFRSKNNLMIIGFFLVLYLLQIIILPHFNNETIILNVGNLFIVFLAIVVSDLLYYRYYLFLKRYNKKFQIIFSTVIWIITFSCVMMLNFFVKKSGYFPKFVEDVGLFVYMVEVSVFGMPLREIFYSKKLEPYIFGVFKNVKSVDEDDYQK